MSVEMICRPISTWPGERKTCQIHSRFKTSWSTTQYGLRREVEHLGGQKILLELEVEEKQLRNDGWLYASSRPSSPGIIVSFESRKGPLRLPCDTFTDWHDNVRAVALALEALRKVDRYGVTSHGEQYRGFNALPSPDDAVEFDIHSAANLVSACTNGIYLPLDILQEFLYFKKASRAASLEVHPDHNDGRDSRFKLLQKAKAVLLKHHGGAA